MQPLLAPGTHVLRRGPRRVQIGLHPDRSVVLPAGDDGTEAAVRHLADLAQEGLALTDDRALRSALPALGAARGEADTTGEVHRRRHAVAALARRAGADLTGALGGLAGHELAVVTTAHPLGELLADDLRLLCRRLGVDPVGRRPPGPRPQGRPRPTTVPVLLAVGEPARDLLDGWLRDATPHLVVRISEGSAVVGPFVLPGRSACLRCLDAGHSEADPAWPLLVEQQARASRHDRPDGIPEPVDPAVAAMALALAAAEVAAYAEGRRPRCVDRVLTLGPVPGDLVDEAVERHAQCGCAWL